MRNLLYGCVVLCFTLAGLLDLRAGETKLGCVALGLVVVNALIFFWR